MAPRVFSRNALVATPDGGLKQVISIRGHQVMTDQPERAGGTDQAPTPLDLLGAALAGCVSLYVQKFCAARSLPIDELAVEVRPVWREDPGRIGRYDVLVHLPAGIPEELHEEIARVAQSCPVHNTLTHLPELTLELCPREETVLA